MATVKQAILKKKINDVIVDLMVKTTSAMVYVDDATTLAAKLETMLTDIADSKTKLATLLGEDEASSITGQINAAVKAAVDAINNEEDPTSVAGKIKACQDAIAAINNAETGILATAKKYTDEKIGLTGTGFDTVKAYVDNMKTTISSEMAGAFHFKGAVDYVADLPTEGVAEGDVYQVRYRGTEGTEPLNAEYSYNGEEFVELGTVMDLSAYSTTEQTTAAINSAVGAAKTEINEVLVTKARFFAQEEQPADLTEYDLWAQIIPDAAV